MSLRRSHVLFCKHVVDLPGAPGAAYIGNLILFGLIPRRLRRSFHNLKLFPNTPLLAAGFFIFAFDPFAHKKSAP
jgi:hypothetical protein